MIIKEAKNKKNLAIALLILSACSTQDKAPSQEEMRSTFIRQGKSMDLYWMDYQTVPTGVLTSIALMMNEVGEFSDPYAPQITYWIESMVSKNAALYAYKQPYPDKSYQTLYLVFFWGYDKNSGKRAFGRGGFKNDYDSLRRTTALSPSSSDANEIAAWKAYHKALQSQNNYISSKGVTMARER